MVAAVRCGSDHELVISAVDQIDGHDFVECVVCGQNYVLEDDTYVPVSPTLLVDAGAWDGDRDGQGLFSDPHWAALDEPR